MITYKYKLKSAEQVKATIKEINETLSSDKFKNYIANKCKVELDKITSESLIGSEYDIAKTYPGSNKTAIGDNYIELYNDSMVDLSNVSQKTISNYPEGLSMAKLVEFGSGVIGARSDAANYAEGWEYDVNNHKDKGWYYEKDGMIYWSKGTEGKLIFHKLQLKIEENMGDWVNEYLENEIGK